MKIKSLCASAVLVGLFCTAIQAQTAWNQGSLIQPQQLSAELQSNAHSPVVLFVGFPVLYRGAHIPDAIFAGPCSTPQGITALKKAVAKFQRDRRVVLYCGCCPFIRCPNVRPAYQTLHDMGFSHVQVLKLDTNFHTDWVEKGYPTQKGN